VHARSSGSNQVAESPRFEYEEDDRSLVYSLRSDGVQDSQNMVLLNLRKSMAEQVRQKLTEKIANSFEGFLDILQVTQDDNGKVASLECDLKADPRSSSPPNRVTISAESDGTFLVYQAVAAEGCKLESTAFDTWLQSVSTFGLSGKCTSLSGLFRFAYEQWKRVLATAPVLSQPLNLSGALDHAADEIALGRPHSAIDIISILLRAENSESIPAALALRCQAYALAGMFSLCILDADQLGMRADGFVSVDALFWKGCSLQALRRQEEAIQAYLTVLELDPNHAAAQDRLDEVLSQATAPPDATTPRASRETQARRHTRRERLDSAQDTGTTGTTASRCSSRSTTPTSCASGDLQQLL